MFNSNNGYSLSDVAAVTGRNNDGVWGGDGAWWIIILFLFAFMGRGWGGYNDGGSTTREEIAYGFDMNGLERGISGLSNGLCDGFYAMNSAISSGFAGVDNAVCTLGYQNAQLINGLENVVQSGNNATQVAMMQGFNGVQAGQTALGTQIQQCCCDNKAMLADIKYQMATDVCGVKTQMANNTRDLIDNENANFRAINDRLTAMEMAAKQDKIEALMAENQSLKFAASQAAQNTLLINELRPCPVPSYVVPNPYVNTCNCNCNYGCGC